jgi:hypothetical protein
MLAGNKCVLRTTVTVMRRRVPPYCVYKQPRDEVLSMITQFGFGSTLGLYAPPNTNGLGGLPVLSEASSLLVEQEVKVVYDSIRSSLHMCY